MKSFLPALIACALGLVTGHSYALEEPDYEVVAEIDNVEIRRYNDYLIAQTLVTDVKDRNAAANTAFRRLFKYISGANSKQAKIEMTAPVQQREQGVKIDMTAPVQQEYTNGAWAVAFVLPKQFTTATAPVPTNPDISIRRVQGDLVAALRYSGRWTDRNVASHSRELLDRLAAADIVARGTVTTAYYNSPFSLPFMRRNEVMVAVSEMP